MKALRYLLPLAFVSMVACQKTEKEMDPIPEPTPVPQECLTFVSERPQTADEEGTRTYWNGSTLLWNSTDQIRMGYTVEGVWQNASGNAAGDAKLYESQGTILTEGDAVASFKISGSFSGNTEGEHVFYAIYPGSAADESMTDAPVTAITIPSVQTPLADSFDPSVDLMLGHSVGTFNSRPTDPVKLLWNRVVAHGLITLNNLPGVESGETVRSITLTAQPGANLTGAQEMNVVTGEYTPSITNSTPNRVVVNGNNLTLDGSGNVSFWMGLLPETLTALTVEVVTNKATYTRSISGFSRTFIANRRNILPINMASAVRKVNQSGTGDKYVLVTDNSEFGEGHYLIGYPASGTSAYVLSGKASGDYGAYQTVAVSDNTITSTDGSNYDVEIVKTANGYSLKLGNQFLGYTSTATSGSNYLYFNSSFSAEKFEWTISVDNGEATIQNVYNSVRKLQWNSKDTRFSCYAGTMQPVRLYRLNTPMVNTRMATDRSVSSAVLNATFSNLGTTNVQDVHFVWGESANALNQVIYAEDFDVTSGSFHATLSSLEENKTYYFKAVMQYCKDGVTYQVLEGGVLSFTTLSSATGGDAGLQWLGCYEIPAIDLVNPNSYSGTGEETFGETNWYNYVTTNSRQKVVTHTYKYNNKVYRNYTTLVDGDKRCPLWTAYVMHKGAYPNNGVERGSFSVNTSYDPGIPKAWQSSGSTSDYNNGNGYSRGHHCASADRKVNDDANNQTFYYTNQSPQWQNGFNSGVWSNLEEAIQNNAPTGRDTLYVVVGTLFENGNTGSSNDGGTVARPSHFYKLLMKCSFDASGAMTAAKGAAYIYTNESHSGQSYSNSAFRTTIDAIEQRTGFNFFANVPAEFQDGENGAESKFSTLW